MVFLQHTKWRSISRRAATTIVKTGIMSRQHIRNSYSELTEFEMSHV